MMNRKGFTLVEIMIVVAIIALLAAIAIPNLLRQRLNANESAAMLTLGTCSAALQSLQGATPVPGFPAALDGLAPAGVPPYLSADMAVAANTFTRQGYIFVYVPGAVVATLRTTYIAYAIPAAPGTSGIRGFAIAEGGVLCSIPVAAVPGAIVAGAACPPGWAPVV